MSAGPLRLQTTLGRAALAAGPAETLVHGLAKLLPAGRGEARMPINLALVIDRTPAMDQEGRLSWLQQALATLGEALGPDDVVSVVAFGERAKAVLPAEPADAAKLRRVVGFLDAQAIAGPAELAEGLRLAGEELKKHARPGAASRAWVFCAGPGAHEPEAELQGRALAEAGVGLTFFGLGAEWNAPLAIRLADAGRGQAHLAMRPQDLVEAVARERRELSRLAFTEAKLRLRLPKGVRLRRVFRVLPAIAQWLPSLPTERDAIVRIGALPDDRPTLVLFELIVPGRGPGETRLAEAELLYEAAVPTPAAHRSGAQDLSVTFAEAPGPANREVARYAEALSAYLLIDRALEARRTGEAEKAAQLLANAHRIVGALGHGPLDAALAQARQTLAGLGTLPETAARGLLFMARAAAGAEG